MAHFAKLDKNNVVIDVHAVNNQVIVDENGQESEELGIQFLSKLFFHENWKQTSYNNRIRKNYAGIGYVYDPQLDAFIPPKTYASWLLNEETCQWEPPIAYPQDGKKYQWDETQQNWIEITVEAEQ